MKKIPGLSELPEILSHVLYEGDMFFAIQAEYAASTSVISRNALVESFATHMRILVGFFELNGSTHDTDITISDMKSHLPSWSAPELSPEQSEYIKVQFKRVHKQVAHLTEQRLEKHGPSWPWEFEDICNVLKPYWDKFIFALDKDHPGLRERARNFAIEAKPPTDTLRTTHGTSSPVAVLGGARYASILFGK